jgi:large subunit ribosomal protein L24
MKIKKGDIIVLSGKDKGKTGKVESVLIKNDMVLVEGMNIMVKHQKNKRTRSQGQVIKKASPIHVSNVALMEDKKAVKVGYKMEDGKKVRVSRKTGKAI